MPIAPDRAADALDPITVQGDGSAAANQVDLPYRMFVLNLASDPAAPEKEFVFINPVLRSPKGMAEAEEDCLTCPAYMATCGAPSGSCSMPTTWPAKELTLELDGLLARESSTRWTTSTACYSPIDSVHGAGRCAFRDRFRESVRRDVRARATFPTTKPSWPILARCWKLAHAN